MIKRIGDLAYEVALPESTAGVDPVFHISQLRKCLRVPEEEVHTEALDLQDTLEYAEYPVKILARAEKCTTRMYVSYCKVLWSDHIEREATWEEEANLKELPHLFKEAVEA